ncbi:damage-control phosphatase ARMT1 family protein [Streptomyces griseoaurantiacus]|uniref:Protein-glutamate O-methyltransferase family protein n=1 Tax=Streptomyces griseoaurantiacus TaxID=68213 RepID=A0A7W2DPK7_9ACTN|nr:damage-control phosphatase ARMT1 family protein [Streptomyces griseoaurantiacus]MBA5220685.1 protein-glutamate O-methyltransferase family protein [Streptomyces griseoaurantiacus]
MSEAAPAPVIVSDDPASFAHGVLAERHPALVARVLDTVPYGPGERAALTALLDNHLKGVVEAPEPGARDAERWTEEWGLPEHLGRSWFAAPFLWAESYFYRRLLDALGYFGSGPWRGVDPFRPFKRAELDGPGTEEELAALDALAEQPREARAAALLHGSLWGNRADLGFRLSVESGHGTGAAAGGTGDARLVADDSEALWSLLPVGTLCLVADNAGRELVPDLLLLDHLLRHGEAERAVLHVKPHPYYVSDATTADVLDAIERLHRAPGEVGAAGRRLWSALAGGRLVLRAHPFSCAPLPYADMPEDLRREFAAADLTVLKGDLNYRRLVGDRLWPPTTPFARPTAYFPGSVAALRTLKSDVITGLDPHTETGLVETEGQRWRTSGAHALIQVRP